MLLKIDSTTSNGRNWQANIDVSKPMGQFCYQQQQPMPPAKPEFSPVFNQQPDPPLELPLEPPLQQGGGPSNVVANILTKGSISSATQPETGQSELSTDAIAFGMYCTVSGV